TPSASLAQVPHSSAGCDNNVVSRAPSAQAPIHVFEVRKQALIEETNRLYRFTACEQSTATEGINSARLHVYCRYQVSTAELVVTGGPGVERLSRAFNPLGHGFANDKRPDESCRGPCLCYRHQAAHEAVFGNCV